MIFPLFEDFCKKESLDGKIITARLGNSELQLKVLTSLKSQEKGFMYENTPLKENEGLLFLYDRPTQLTFWMKNVRFPLDIIFFDENRQYINHHEMKAQLFDTDRNLIRYSSSAPAQYAVELKNTWCRKFLDLNNCNLIL